MRKEKFATGHIYHICNKSIANYKIYNRQTSLRFYQALSHYNSSEVNRSLSNTLQNNSSYRCEDVLCLKNKAVVKILAYCIMPDHYHLLVKNLEYSLSQYISNVENSFTRYFNLKFNRKGPLWQSRFRAVRIKTNEPLLHVSRYIHLNPTTSSLVRKPEEWEYSSYKNYINDPFTLGAVIHEITIKDSKRYQKFCEDQIDYQKKLKRIKRLLLE